MRRELLLATLLCTQLGCDRAVNVPPLRRYTEALLRTSAAKLTLGRCDMFDRSRKGFCIVEGAASELATFRSGLKLAPQPSKTAFLTCLELPEFGISSGAGPAPKPGIERLVATGALPSNPDNVKLVAVYAGPTSACVEMQYPYG